MFSSYFIVFIILYVLGCSIEFIVFNEEILLALCFFSFIFFSYNTFSDSLFTTLQARAAKFESEFLISFSIKKKVSVVTFQTLFFTRGFQSKFQILLASILVFLTFSKKNLLLNQINTINSISLAKLSELLLINNKLMALFQKNCVDQLLYPLVFSSKRPLSFLNKNEINLQFSTTSKAIILKSLTI